MRVRAYVLPTRRVRSPATPPRAHARIFSLPLSLSPSLPRALALSLPLSPAGDLVRSATAGDAPTATIASIASPSSSRSVAAAPTITRKAAPAPSSTPSAGAAHRRWARSADGAWRKLPASAASASSEGVAAPAAAEAAVLAPLHPALDVTLRNLTNTLSSLDAKLGGSLPAQSGAAGEAESSGRAAAAPPAVTVVHSDATNVARILHEGTLIGCELTPFARAEMAANMTSGVGTTVGSMQVQPLGVMTFRLTTIGDLFVATGTGRWRVFIPRHALVAYALIDAELVVSYADGEVAPRGAEGGAHRRTLTSEMVVGFTSDKERAAWSRALREVWGAPIDAQAAPGETVAAQRAASAPPATVGRAALDAAQRADEMRSRAQEAMARSQSFTSGASASGATEEEEEARSALERTLNSTIDLDSTADGAATLYGAALDSTVEEDGEEDAALPYATRPKKSATKQGRAERRAAFSPSRKTARSPPEKRAEAAVAPPPPPPLVPLAMGATYAPSGTGGDLRTHELAPLPSPAAAAHAPGSPFKLQLEQSRVAVASAAAQTIAAERKLNALRAHAAAVEGARAETAAAEDPAYAAPGADSRTLEEAARVERELAHYRTRYASHVESADSPLAPTASARLGFGFGVDVGVGVGVGVGALARTPPRADIARQESDVVDATATPSLALSWPPALASPMAPLSGNKPRVVVARPVGGTSSPNPMGETGSSDSDFSGAVVPSPRGGEFGDDVVGMSATFLAEADAARAANLAYLQSAGTPRARDGAISLLVRGTAMAISERFDFAEEAEVRWIAECGAAPVTMSHHACCACTRAHRQRFYFHYPPASRRRVTTPRWSPPRATRPSTRPSTRPLTRPSTRRWM